MLSNRKIFLIAVLLTVFTISAYVVIVVIPARLAKQTYDGAKEIGRDISELFNVTPEIVVNNTVILQQQTAILELATVSQRFQHQYDWTNTWMGSTKKISIQGIFEAKAGFDLKRKFTIQIEDTKATVHLPAPKILSVESVGATTFRDEQGVWNWVNNEDHSKAITAFQQDARKYASHAGFIQQAETNMERELKNILKLHGKNVTVIFDQDNILQQFEK